MVKAEIENALKSDNPWKRYWGLIVCSSLGKEASTFGEIALEIAKKDSENLVRIRAAEFLTLNDYPVATDIFDEILKNAKSETEANLVLNSIALIKTVRPGFNINIAKSMFPSEWLEKEGDLVRRRIEFINDSKI